MYGLAVRHIFCTKTIALSYKLYKQLNNLVHSLPKFRSINFMLTQIHREIMPLRITVAYDTLCHGGICQNGESRMSGPLYTVAIEISNTLCQMIWSSPTPGNVSFVTLLHNRRYIVQGHSQCYLGLHLTFICHSVQRPAHSSLATVADVTVAMRCHMP